MDTFRAFLLTPFNEVKAVLLGAEPYPSAGTADGLAFSSRDGNLPRTLEKLLWDMLMEDRKACEDKWDPAPDPCLERWAEQGVLLLNTHLTVKRNEPRSHQQYGWYQFTKAAITALLKRPKPLTVVAIGSEARDLVYDTGFHSNSFQNPLVKICRVLHPLDVKVNPRGTDTFFLDINNHLEKHGEEKIDWLRCQTGDPREASTEIQFG